MRSFDFIGIPHLLWARDVEDAKVGAPGTVRPPAPIANAMGV
ncbi:MAG: hypothetical protein Q7U60_04905 [Candidatus Methanoperedens sp.]|nr:hypothetical protein [Candidatus Methanoperedens sp.]